MPSTGLPVGPSYKSRMVCYKTNVNKSIQNAQSITKRIKKCFCPSKW